MSKKKTGLLIAFGTALGAAAACVSYYLKYKSFSDELDKDFHDYEDEDEFSAADGEKSSASAQEASKRNYITIDSAKCKCPGEADDASEEASEKEKAAAEKPEEKPEETPVSEQSAKEKSTADVTVEEDTEGTDA